TTRACGGRFTRSIAISTGRRSEAHQCRRSWQRSVLSTAGFHDDSTTSTPSLRLVAELTEWAAIADDEDAPHRSAGELRARSCSHSNVWRNHGDNVHNGLCSRYQ